MSEEPALFENMPARKPRGKHYVKPRGHVMIPGSGPVGETCGTCRHLVRFRQCKRWCKCGLNEVNWTGGRATDILVRDLACIKWEARDD